MHRCSLAKVPVVAVSQVGSRTFGLDGDPGLETLQSAQSDVQEGYDAGSTKHGVAAVWETLNGYQTGCNVGVGLSDGAFHSKLMGCVSSFW